MQRYEFRDWVEAIRNRCSQERKREEEKQKFKRRGGYFRETAVNSQLEIARPSRACTLNFNRRFDGTKSLFSRLRVSEEEEEEPGKGEREREMGEGNNLPEIRLVAFGDWIHSYLSPRQSVDCNPSLGVAFSPSPPPYRHRHHHLFGRNPLATPRARSTVPFPAHSLTSAVFFSPRREENAKPRSLMGILNTDDSSVLFPRHPFSPYPLAPSAGCLPIAFLFISKPLALPSVDGIRERYRVLGTIRLQLDLFGISGPPHPSSSLTMCENRGHCRSVLSMMLSFKDAKSDY